MVVRDNGSCLGQYNHYFYVLYYHLWPDRLHHVFPHYLINGTIFGGCRGEVTAYKVRVLIYSTNIVWKSSHSKKELCEIISEMYIDLHVKYSIFLSDFNKTLQKYEISNFMKVFQFATQKFKDEYIENYNFASCFIWV
jgi:hypothetical protein